MFDPFSKPPPPPGSAVNIFSHNQSGGITAHTVNVGGLLPRQLDSALVDLLDQHITTGSRVEVCATLGDVEAHAFAEQIHRHLHRRATLHVEGVNQSIFSPPIRGTRVSLNQDKGGPVQILVGSNG